MNKIEFIGIELVGALLAIIGFSSLTFVGLLFRILLSRHYSIFEILSISYAFTLPFAFAYIFYYRKASLRLHVRHHFLMFLRSAIFFVSQVAFFITVFKIDIGIAYVLFYTSPIFVTIFAVIILGEKIKLYRVVAITFGVIGVLVILNPFSITSFRNDSIGYLALGIFASITNALAIIIVKKIRSTENVTTMAVYPIMFIFIISTVFMLFNYQPVFYNDLILMLLLGLLSLVGLFFVMLALGMAQATYIAPLQYSQILWGMLFSYVLYNSSPSLSNIIGTVIIISASAFIIWRERALKHLSGSKQHATMFRNATMFPPIFKTLSQKMKRSGYNTYKTNAHKKNKK